MWLLAQLRQPGRSLCSDISESTLPKFLDTHLSRKKFLPGKEVQGVMITASTWPQLRLVVLIPQFIERLSSDAFGNWRTGRRMAGGCLSINRTTPFAALSQSTLTFSPTITTTETPSQTQGWDHYGFFALKASSHTHHEGYWTSPTTENGYEKWLRELYLQHEQHPHER